MDKQESLNACTECRLLHEQFDRRLEKVEEIVAELKEKSTIGFPNDDPHGHRRGHEDSNKVAESRQKLKTELITHTLKGLSWATLVFIGISVWNYIVGQVQK
jgi:hypothetical protein